MWLTGSYSIRVPWLFPAEIHTWVNLDSQTEKILNFINNKSYVYTYT